MDNTNTNENNVKNKKSISFLILKIFLAVVVVLALFYFGFTCQVKEGEKAVVLRFGAIRQEITDAGIYLKLPWPFETVTKYDGRLQYLESDNLETITQDKRNIIIQSYVIWNIDDIKLYHNSVGTQGSANSFIKNQVFSATNSIMGSYNLNSLVSLNNEEIKINEIQDEIFKRVAEACKNNYGINIQDVSFLRLSLPNANLESVFAQMTAERQKEIDTILANAQTEANRITTQADAKAAEIIGKGTTEAAEIYAKAESEVASIYAAAQSSNLELFKFLKELDTIATSVGENTILVVKADEYPFNILSKYSDYITTENDQTIIKDLSYILTQLNEEDRTALTNAIYELIKNSMSDD
jgi:membrane protease subunit HflC